MCALSARLAGLLARHRARAELRGEEPYCGVGADAGCPSQAVTIAGRGTLPPGHFACLGRVATNGGLVSTWRMQRLLGGSTKAIRTRVVRIANRANREAPKSGDSRRIARRSIKSRIARIVI